VETKVTTLFERIRAIFSRLDLGRRGEDLAVDELKRRGYRILDRRWRCRLGEIDVVAEDGDTLVVVEVKSRSRGDYGPPVDAVDRVKRRKLLQLARAYLRSRRLEEAKVTVRFDVVGVTARSGEPPRVEIVRSAFRF
jgi:putative endonuclease